MDIYLTNLKNNDRLRFPMLPQEISVKLGNQFANYTIIQIGEVRIPSGTTLDSFSWNGILPGQKRNGAPYVRGWKDPKAIYKWIESLKAQNGKPVKARLLITETPINCDVYLTSFSATPTGGYGDINYTITLTQAKEIRVTKSALKAAAATQQGTAPARPSPPAANTYTVKGGDTLWGIAQQFYGSGAQYPKIYEANKGVIGSNPNLIYPGQVYTIPG